MRDQGIGFSPHALLGRMMEMKLLELVPIVADRNEAPRRIDHLNRVSVVDHAQGHRLVGKRDRWKLSVSRLADIDRRLLLAARALGVGWIETRPVRRAMRSLVLPVCSTMLLRRKRQRDPRERGKADNCSHGSTLEAWDDGR